MGAGIGEPSFIVDITEAWEEKLAALACYESQPGPVKESWRGEEYFGNLIGVPYGEAIYCKEAIGVTDLFSVL